MASHPTHPLVQFRFAGSPTVRLRRQRNNPLDGPGQAGHGPRRRPTGTLPPMSKGSAYALLGVMSAGVFLAGLELMVTAVALPTIILDFSANAQNPFAELRRASWIVNGYLLAYIVAMPLAGRMADVWGARRLFLGALGLFVAGSFVAGAAQSIDQLIAGRVVQGVGGGILVPVGTAVAS